MIIQKELDLPYIESESVNAFISRWKSCTGSERANYQLFLTELCELLHLPKPDPANSETETNNYVFERRVDIRNSDGSVNRGYIDLYRQDSFVLEAKQTGKEIASLGWDKAMLAAHNQADNYVRALPPHEGRPPFIILTDVGRSIEIYSEFTRTGARYVPFPDPKHHRIRVEDLRDSQVQDRLRRIWLAPDSLDPSKYSAQVTREVSSKLAELAKSLELDGYDIERVAHFLKRCLFTMFAEDVSLIPEYSFTALLKRLLESPELFVDSMSSLWNTMNDGGFEGQLMHKIPKFNGGLFKGIDPVPLRSEQIQLLVDAANYDWRYVEPAIFGTLLERALDPRERHKLGAHYTPRAYVERLVMPALINPLIEEWSTIQVVVTALLQKDEHKKALNELHHFHHYLCELKILDPACGSGNFLYVALEHLKRLEGEVLNVISDLSSGQVGFETEGLTVSPRQFIGLEINPRAAAIAELVLWIGYLQWHYRIHGKLDLPEPILNNFKNIQNEDALIKYESRTPLIDSEGRNVTIWDRVTYKINPVNGNLVPDDSGREQVYQYNNPEMAEWPEADFIIGNPPFIGASTMRRSLGDGYVDAVREVYDGIVPESADFVMYWWHTAAEKTRLSTVQRFGFIATNSLRQTFNRRILDEHLNDKVPLHLVFAIPDHPWVDSSDGADVRISMTVGSASDVVGEIRSVTTEKSVSSDEFELEFSSSFGRINSDLTIGADISKLNCLKSNSGLSSKGVMLIGKGFIVDADFLNSIPKEMRSTYSRVVKPYRNGRDIAQISRDYMVIDLHGLSSDEARDLYPIAYQQVLEQVKPERDQNKEKYRRENWWLFGRKNLDLREAIGGLSRYISTIETSKHRFFVFLDGNILPDNKLVNVGLSDSYYLGLLSSRLHVLWSFRVGSRMGVGNDPVYVKTMCFDSFPFPDIDEICVAEIRAIAEKIDRHRKKQQSEYSDLKLTDIYNVVEKVRSSEELTDKEKVIHQKGLVSILIELHDDLDKAVFKSYGWDDLGKLLIGSPGGTTPLADKSQTQREAEEELMVRLVDLNNKRYNDENGGVINWLRPDFQNSTGLTPVGQTKADLGIVIDPKDEVVVSHSWPKEMKDQIKLVQLLLNGSPLTSLELVEKIKRKPNKAVNQVLLALEVLGKAELRDGKWYVL